MKTKEEKKEARKIWDKRYLATPKGKASVERKKDESHKILKREYDKKRFSENKQEIKKRHREYGILYRKTHREQKRARDLKRYYGISIEEYNEILLKQNGACAICFNPETIIQWGKIKPLSVDHSHNTGKVRGLLCHNCNAVLGYSKDNIFTLKSATNYLQKCEF